MSRRDAGAASRQGARHARDRLRSTLGAGPGLLLTDNEKFFEYDGGAQLGGEGLLRKVPAQGPPGTGMVGPAIRWRVGLPVALLIAALAVLGGAWFWSQVAAGQPEVVPLSEMSPQESAPTGEEETSGQETQPAGPPGLPGGPQASIVIIHVAGAVAMPGVVQLPAGSRVHQAIAEAGGGTPTADLNRLNLAAVLTDGQKLYVPQDGEEIPAGSSGSPDAAGEGTGGGGTASAGGKVNLNTATVEELDALPKVGPVLAQRIVDWRKEHGPFASVEEIDAVEGVGPKMLERSFLWWVSEVAGRSPWSRFVDSAVQGTGVQGSAAQPQEAPTASATSRQQRPGPAPARRDVQRETARLAERVKKKLRSQEQETAPVERPRRRTDVRLGLPALLVWGAAVAGVWLTPALLALLCGGLLVTALLLLARVGRGRTLLTGRRSFLTTTAVALVLAAAAAAHSAVSSSQRHDGPLAEATASGKSVVAVIEITGSPRALTLPGQAGTPERWSVEAGRRKSPSAATLSAPGPSWWSWAAAAGITQCLARWSGPQAS